MTGARIKFSPAALLRGGLIAAMLAAGLAPASGALAQSLNFGKGDSDQPIEIFADNGIEWQQENLIFLARGNARAVRGQVTVLPTNCAPTTAKNPTAAPISGVWMPTAR